MHSRYPYRAEHDWRRTLEPRCKNCGGRIVWVKSAKNPNKMIPCEIAFTNGNGEKTLVLVSGQMVPKAPVEVIGREVHFGRVCPEGILDVISRKSNTS